MKHLRVLSSNTAPHLSLISSCLQSGLSINQVVSSVRNVSNLLFGLSCQELEDAVGTLNRLSPQTLV